jgi:hypothetical protein
MWKKSLPRYCCPQILDAFILSLYPTMWGWNMNTHLVCSASAARSLPNSLQYSFYMANWHHSHRSQTDIPLNSNPSWFSCTFPMTSRKIKLKNNADKASFDHYEYEMHQENARLYGHTGSVYKLSVVRTRFLMALPYRILMRIFITLLSLLKNTRT